LYIIWIKSYYAAILSDVVFYPLSNDFVHFKTIYNHISVILVSNLEVLLFKIQTIIFTADKQKQFLFIKKKMRRPFSRFDADL
jgi:hypothetical protein